MKFRYINMACAFMCFCLGFQQANAEFHVVTVASHPDEGLDRLKRSCEEFDIDLEVLGMGLPYKFNTQKLTYMQEYLDKLPNRDIVLFVDGYDVFFLADKATILAKFHEMKKPIIMAAERKFSCYPKHLKKFANYPTSPTHFRYVNSGTYMGYVGALKSMLKEFGPWEGARHDQEFFHKYFLRHQKKIKLDRMCEIFFPLPGLSDPRVVKVLPKEKKVLLLETKTKPMIVHGAGSGFGLYKNLYDRLFK